MGSWENTNSMLLFFFLLMAPLLAESPAIRVLKLSDGVPFKMGKVDSRRILHPDMG
jgi:hypothetical protein